MPRRTEFVKQLLMLDDKLVRKGFPPMAPWWKEQLMAFYSRDLLTIVLRVGRRGGKSSTLCRVAAAEGLYGEHVVPPGDVGVVPFVSVDKREARMRLRTIKAILDALKVPYRATREEIELLDRAVMFRVFAATIAGVSGFTSIGVFCDEVAKWKDTDVGTNPANEVLGSITPTLSTQPLARMFLSSSPWSTLDAHYDAFERGNVDGQMVAKATTWEANPTLPEKRTHVLEPDERKWAREYAAIPQAAVANAFEPAMIDRAMREPPRAQLGKPVLVIDPSSGGLTTGDAFTCCVVQWAWPTIEEEPWVTYEEHGVHYYVLDENEERVPNPEYVKLQRRHRPFIWFRRLGAFKAAFSGGLRSEQIIERLRDVCEEEGIDDVHSDQREAFALEALFRAAGLRFAAHHWNQPNKVQAVATLKRWLSEGSIVLEPHPALRKELGHFSEKVTPSGMITYGARGKAHDDYVALLLTAAMADTEGQINSSPLFSDGDTKHTETLDERQVRFT